MLYLSAISEVVNRTGNPAALEAEAGRIAAKHGMRPADVLDDLQRMRRIAVSEAIRAAIQPGFRGQEGN